MTASSDGIDSKASRPGRGRQAAVEGCQGRGARRGSQRQVKRVGRPQWSLPQRQEQVLGAPMDVAGQLDALVDTIVEAREDRVLEASCGLARHRSVAQTAGDRRDDLAHGQVRQQDVVTPFDQLVEVVALGLGQVQLQQRARVAVDGAG